MIIRLNQLELAAADAAAGTVARRPWPGGTSAYELLILAADEERRPLAVEFRRQQLRYLLAEVADALRGDEDQLVARLEGLLGPGELAAAYGHLTDEHGHGRFSVGAAQQLVPGEPAAGSVRLHLPAERLAVLMTDGRLGLERSVRLRVLAVPEALVNPLLDIDDGEDERWAEVLPRCRYVLATTRGLGALVIHTAAYDTERLKALVVGRLTANGGEEAKAP